MLRNSRVCVKAVHYGEIFRILRCLHRKICRTSAAKDQDIDLICHMFRFVRMVNLCVFGQDPYIFRISSCKYCRKLHIRILFDGALNAASKISITHNSDSDRHIVLLFFLYLMSLSPFYQSTVIVSIEISLTNLSPVSSRYTCKTCHREVLLGTRQ